MVTEVVSGVLDAVFGHGPGDTPEERAVASSRTYVRSLSQIAEDTPRAKGRRLNAAEALETFGLDVLREVASEGAALICESPRAAGRLVSDRRNLLGLEIRHLLATAGVSAGAIEKLESYRWIPIRQAERIARALGLDERTMSWKSEAPAENERVAVRLRTIGDDDPRLTSHVVSVIAEASWVAAAQARLQEKLGLVPSPHGIEPSADYGAPGRPAFRCGYELASRARDELGLGRENPLEESLRDLAESRLGIPVIQVEMGDEIAGATIDVGGNRAIILNLGGRNRNALVRRSTVAHELGHYLYDPPGNLETMRVDDYDQVADQAGRIHDPVEQRANAFGVEFIAPRSALAAHFRKEMADHNDAPRALLALIDRFGVSHTAVRNQLQNALAGEVDPESLVLPRGGRPDADKWEAIEGYTVNYHPLERLRSSRAGRFSALVVRAARERHISWDTAAEMLECDEREIRNSADSIAELFPDVFSRP